MADITRERSGEIVRTAFQVLRDHPDGLQVRKVIAEVESRLVLTPFERSDFPNQPGVRRFDKIIRFNTISAVKAGWLVKSKGDWTVTEAGLAALEEIPDPADFMRESIRLYRQWKKAQPNDEEAVDEEDFDDAVDAASTSTTVEEAEESAWAEIETYLRLMPPYEFQGLAGALLRAMGYHIAWDAPPGPDGGVDLLAYTDPLGAEGPRIKVQVKRHVDKKTGVDGLRSFMAVLGSQDVGIFIAMAGFSSDAHAEARAQQNRRITLLDLKQLFALWVANYEKVSDEDKRRLPLRPVFFLAPDD